MDDKERLDWLEDNMKDLEWCCDDTMKEWYEMRSTLDNYETGRTIRQTIDKAMEG